MNYFLAKTDPETYSITDMEREKRTVWDGVKNAQALQAIAKMRPGDKVFLYHSGGESAIVGMAKVLSAPAGEPKALTVAMEFLGRLEPATTLREVKESGEFGDFLLVRNSRLSTMECPAEFAAWMKKRYKKGQI
jgi:predicted RNA-binding protein with PUA-like domain